MIASVHPMLFRETYREVFAQKWLEPDDPTLSSVHKTLQKCSNAQVDNFISFPTSTRSPKTEFGAESFGQNIEGQRRG
jgi:hypothetical protein